MAEGNILCFETLDGPWVHAPAAEYVGIVGVIETILIELNPMLPAA